MTRTWNMTEVARRAALTLFVLVVAGALLSLGGFDLDAARSALSGLSPRAAIAVGPFVGLLVLEAWAWSIALDLPLRAATLGRLVAARLGIEAVSLTVPGSILVSDGIAPVVFARAAAIAVPSAVAGVALKKWGIVLGHGIVLALAAAVGGAFFARADTALELAIGARATLVLAGIASAIGALWLSSLLDRGPAERILRTLGRLPSAFVRRVAAHASRSAAHADDHAHRFFTGPRRRVVALALVSSLVWLAESLEVYVILRVLGASPPFAHVLAMEALITIVRSAAFFSPGGLGAQELAYLLLVPPLLGEPTTTTASAFVVLRRVRDLATIVLGYASLTRSAVRTSDVTRAPTS